MNTFTVFALISAPGAFEMVIWYCHFTLQLAPPVPTKVFSYSMNSFIFLSVLLGKHRLIYTFWQIFSTYHQITPLKVSWTLWILFCITYFFLNSLIFIGFHGEKRWGGVKWRGGDKQSKYGRCIHYGVKCQWDLPVEADEPVGWLEE